MDSSVGAMAANVMTAAAAAADLATELQSGVATAANLATVAGYLDTEIAAIVTTLGTPAGASVSADVAAMKVDTAATKVKTDQLVFTGASRVDANVAAVNNSTTGVDKLSAHLPAILKAIVAAGSTTTAVVLNATTGIDGAAPSSVDDFYNGCVLIFTSGALAGQRTSVSDYTGSTKTLTVVALTGAPAAAVTAVIV